MVRVYRRLDTIHIQGDDREFPRASGIVDDNSDRRSSKGDSNCSVGSGYNALCSTPPLVEQSPPLATGSLSSIGGGGFRRLPDGMSPWRVAPDATHHAISTGDAASCIADLDEGHIGGGGGSRSCGVVGGGVFDLSSLSALQRSYLASCAPPVSPSVRPTTSRRIPAPSSDEFTDYVSPAPRASPHLR